MGFKRNLLTQKFQQKNKLKMKYLGNLNFRLSIITKFMRAVKKSISFQVQRLIRQRKNEQDENKLKRREERFQKLRKIDPMGIKMLAIVMLRYQFKQEVASHSEEIEKRVRKNYKRK